VFLIGYELTLHQMTYIIERFFGGAPVRRIALDFRNKFGLPISAATILRRVVEMIKIVNATADYLMKIERTEAKQPRFGFTPVLEHIWEIDEIYLLFGRKNWPLIVFKDLKTCFIVAKIAKSVTVQAVTQVLVCAREIANKCLNELRGDDHPAYQRSVKRAFEKKNEVNY
jgi:hypothetical protein